MRKLLKLIFKEIKPSFQYLIDYDKQSCLGLRTHFTKDFKAVMHATKSDMVFHVSAVTFAMQLACTVKVFFKTFCSLQNVFLIYIFFLYSKDLCELALIQSFKNY